MARGLRIAVLIDSGRTTCSNGVLSIAVAVALTAPASVARASLAAQYSGNTNVGYTLGDQVVDAAINFAISIPIRNAE